MPNPVEFVREKCKEKGIKISKLEQDLGYSNGYFNPKKLKKIPYERAVEIAEYLGCEIEPLLSTTTRTIVIPRTVPESLRKALGAGGVAYYPDEETASLAQEMFDDPDMRALFSMKRNMDPAQFKNYMDFMKAQYRLEHPEDDY